MTWSQLFHCYTSRSFRLFYFSNFICPKLLFYVPCNRGYWPILVKRITMYNVDNVDIVTWFPLRSSIQVLWPVKPASARTLTGQCTSMCKRIDWHNNQFALSSVTSFPSILPKPFTSAIARPRPDGGVWSEQDDRASYTTVVRSHASAERQTAPAWPLILENQLC